MHNVLAFDFGMRHIGVAVGQKITGTANPLCVLKARDGVPVWQEIAELIERWAAHTLLVGLPLNMDGSEQLVTKAAKKFAAKLHGRFHLPVFLADERLTTQEAKSLYRQKNTATPERLDAVAAALLLQAWLNR